MSIQSEGDNSVKQQGVVAHGDVVGRDKTNIEYHIHPGSARIVEQLLKKLDAEVAENEQVKEISEELAYYYNRRSEDGVDGLEAKLEKANRSSEKMSAFEKKELFVKVLEKWALYGSAQKILAYLLAKAEHEFNYNIRPQIASTNVPAINELVTKRIVEPIVSECGHTVFGITHAVAMGIVFWLAEQCYVRWHS